MIFKKGLHTLVMFVGKINFVLMLSNLMDKNMKKIYSVNVAKKNMTGFARNVHPH